jgi:hypothetical protein
MNSKCDARNRFFILITIFLSIMLVSGCATRVTVDVNAITNTAIKSAGHRYILTNAAGKTDVKDLYFQEFSRYFQTVLQQQGYTRVSDKKDADLEIRFNYGLSTGRTGISTFAWPLYETIGGETITITEKTTNASGKPVTTTRTIRLPARVERVGTSLESRSYTLYTRSAGLEARLLNKDGSVGEVVWVVNINSVGESNDLRAIMPYLAAASAQFIGKNTGQQRVIELEKNDPRVQALRQDVQQ